jgi:hypothetical protein
MEKENEEYTVENERYTNNIIEDFTQNWKSKFKSMRKEDKNSLKYFKS